MTYLLVDTCVLSDIMRQYNPLSPHKGMIEGKFLRKNMVRMINPIIEDERGLYGCVVTSTFAFLELINKFNEIFKEEIANKKMTLARIVATIQQPPSWLIIDNMDIETAKCYCCVPNTTSGGEHISSDDAVHIATAIQRGDDVVLLTIDHVLKQLHMKHITVITD